MVSVLSWVLVAFIVLLFTTNLFNSIVNYGISTGYEGALGRLLKTYLLCLLVLIISVIIGVSLLRQKQIKLRQFITMSVFPPLIFIIFTAVLVRGFVH